MWHDYVGLKEIDETENGIQEELSNPPENSFDSLDSLSFSGNY